MTCCLAVLGVDCIPGYRAELTLRISIWFSPVARWILSARSVIQHGPVKEIPSCRANTVLSDRAHN
jgi:hypothetical protein